MMNTNRTTSLCIGVLYSLLMVPAVYADVYKYIDKHNRVVFTDTPKNSQYVKLVKTWKGWELPKTDSSSHRHLARNKQKHSSTINHIASRHGLRKRLVHAVIMAESAYDPNAVSRAGAVGLMQLMPETAKRYGVHDRRNPSQNVEGGTRYLRDLLVLYNDNLRLALAAYNAGEGAVAKYNYTIPPYKETQNYVKKVLAFMQESNI